MAVRALALSGGGARGSFQLGALAAIYDVYGFRPDVIAGTSVGSVNGIKLALGRPPAINDPTAILAAVAAGTPDPQLAALRALEVEWSTFTSTDNFFLLQPALDNPSVRRLMSMMRTREGDPPLNIEDFLKDRVANTAVPELIATVKAALKENAIFNLDPVRDRLNDPAKLNLTDLAAGTPLYLAAVALESGRLRYIDGKGIFTERDGVTPVMSALMASDVAAALDENLQPLDATRAARITGLITRYRSAIAAITAARGAHEAATTRAQRLAALAAMARNSERGEYLLDALQAQVSGLRLTTKCDPRRGVLASAAMPVFFDPILIGAERYIDGGVREIIPMEIAVRAGVTDVIGICCSTLELPRVDDKSNAGLPSVGLRSLTEIALNEVTFSDIEAVRQRGITCTVIAPTFNVHGATDVEPSLIEISTDYGWMRACDEVQPAVDAARREFRMMSDLITTVRLRSYTLEKSIDANTSFFNAASARDDVTTVRTYRWIVRELLGTRARIGLPTSPQARRWWTGWARTLRPVGPFGTGSVWSKLSAFSANGTEVQVAAQVSDPDAFALDAGSLVDAGNDRVYWVVRGATFLAATETESTTSRTPVLVVPHGTMTALPRIPRGSHLMAEQDTPSEVWIIRNEKRYRATPAVIAASGLGGQAVAIVPPDGLAQIPDGGAAYWLGGLYISDSARNPVEQWEPTPQVAGTSTTTSVGLTNRSTRAATVSALTITTGLDTPGSAVFSVTSPLPLTIQPNSFAWVGATFRPPRAGSISGTVSVTSDDPTVAQFTLPLSTAATPIGPHGQLEVSPTGLDFGVVRVGQPVGQNVTLTNSGGRDLGIVDLHVADGSPVGQFAIPFSLPTQLAPGQSATVYVSSTPTVRGRVTATLSADVSSRTNAPQPFLQHVDVPLAATAQAPVVLLAGTALPPLRPGPLRPGPLRPGPLRPGDLPGAERLVVELQRLDFGPAAPGTLVTRTFWVRNVGDVALTVSGVDTTNQSAFGIVDASIFPAVIAQGGELAVEANFLAPPVAGRPAAAELGIHSDDPARPRAPLTVLGRASGPHLTMQPVELLDLGSGSPPSGVLTITADGTDPVRLLKVGVDNPDFTFSGFPAMPAVLAPGSSLSITVICTATTPGQHGGRMALANDASPSETLVFLRAQI